MADLAHAVDSDGPPFSVITSETAMGTTAVVVSGEVDLLTAPRVGAAVEAAQRDGVAVLLDLREVDFLGSAGLSVLVDAARRAADQESRFAVLVAARAVTRAIEVTGLDSALTIFDDEAQAMEHLTP